MACPDSLSTVLETLGRRCNRDVRSRTDDENRHRVQGCIVLLVAGTVNSVARHIGSRLNDGARVEFLVIPASAE
jgi:hypothetical protein